MTSRDEGYTPDTDEVRRWYGKGTMFRDTRDAEFNRWLERVRADAWAEGYEAGAENQADMEGHRYRPPDGEAFGFEWRTNPYRKENPR